LSFSGRSISSPEKSIFEICPRQAPQLAALTYLLPVVGTILGIVWLGEHGSFVQVVGGALALAGVYWIESGRQT
jgi:drug/metabolite transporter (DMT)-like permease